MGALKDSTKALILEGLNATSDVDKTPVELRDIWADKLATAINTSIKQALTQVVSAGVPVPQDGGAGLKTTMLAKISTL